MPNYTRIIPRSNRTEPNSDIFGFRGGCCPANGTRRRTDALSRKAHFFDKKWQRENCTNLFFKWTSFYACMIICFLAFSSLSSLGIFFILKNVKSHWASLGKRWAWRCNTITHEKKELPRWMMAFIVSVETWYSITVYANVALFA